jgi:predicted thioredoxin/glutaredoxin
MRLEIYIADHCDNCEEAFRLAELAADVRGVQVRVVNIDAPADAEIPATVIAVPTYTLDGRVISLGNPYPDELLCLLRQGSEEVAS